MIVIINPTTKEPTTFEPTDRLNLILSGPYQNVTAVSEEWVTAERKRLRMQYHNEFFERERNRPAPWTPAQNAPFTTDQWAIDAVDSIFCVEHVRQDEATPGFIGWCVGFKRPMSVDAQGVLWYAGPATVFPNYAEAIAAAVTTFAYVKANGYSWFRDEKLRILSLATGVTAGVKKYEP